MRIAISQATGWQRLFVTLFLLRLENPIFLPLEFDRVMKRDDAGDTGGVMGKRRGRWKEGVEQRRLRMEGWDSWNGMEKRARKRPPSSGDIRELNARPRVAETPLWFLTDQAKVPRGASTEDSGEEARRRNNGRSKTAFSLPNRSPRPVISR